MGYATSNTEKVKGLTFEFSYDVPVFDTESVEITVKGVADVTLYFGSGDPDDENDYTIDFTKCQYACDVIEGVEPVWKNLNTDLKKELCAGKNRELMQIWDDLAAELTLRAWERITEKD